MLTIEVICLCILKKTCRIINIQHCTILSAFISSRPTLHIFNSLKILNFCYFQFLRWCSGSLLFSLPHFITEEYVSSGAAGSAISFCRTEQTCASEQMVSFNQKQFNQRVFRPYNFSATKEFESYPKLKFSYPYFFATWMFILLLFFYFN